MSESLNNNLSTRTKVSMWIQKYWWAWLLPLFAIAAIAGNGTKNDIAKGVAEQKAENAKVKSETPVKQPIKAASINDAVRDGKFEFTVTGMECGLTSAGANEYLQKKPQGEYCAVAMTVKNIGDKAQSLFSANQKVLNAANQTFSADDTATMYASPDSGSWYSNINPGNTVTGKIYFDVPAGTELTTAVLHDSAYSAGVKVALK